MKTSFHCTVAIILAINTLFTTANPVPVSEASGSGFDIEDIKNLLENITTNVCDNNNAIQGLWCFTCIVAK